MTLVVVVFVLVYAGMAAGRLPGTAIDRTGFAVIAAAGLWLSGEVTGEDLVASVDFPTLIVLLSLMLLSAQFELAGFYRRLAWRLALAECSGLVLLGLTTMACGALAAIFTNDVVVFALTPMLCRGLSERGLDPRPFVIAIACAANIGSAATLIGNPQNVLIAQVGGLDFWAYAAVAAPLALCGLLVVVGIVGTVWHRALRRGRHGGPAPGSAVLEAPELDGGRLAKGVIAAGLLLLLLGAGASQLSAALAAGAFLLLSRQLPTRHLLAGADWPLLCLFTGLFVVTGAFAQTPWPAESLSFLGGVGLHPTDPGALAAISLAGSNTIGNVPLVLLLLTILPAPDAETLYALALLSTLAGNLLVTGSLANIIALERAASVGVRVSFRDHALCGVPVTLLTMVAAVGWLCLV